MSHRLTDPNGAACLRDLCARMNKRCAEEKQAFADRIAFTPLDFSRLPTFGGPVPRDASNIWSWDATHRIVPNMRGGSWFQIIPRDDLFAELRTYANAG